MNKAKKTDIVIACVLAALLLLAAVLAILPGAGGNGEKRRAGSYTEFDGKKIGILTGTNMEAATFEFFPKSKYLYFNGYPDLNTALLSGTIDAYLGDEPALRSIHAEEPDIDYFRSRLTYNSYSFAFRKNDPEEKALCDSFNRFLAKIRADGTYEEIDRTWFGTDESKKVVDTSDLTGENGVIHVVTTSVDEPFSYIKDGKNVGFDIDVAVRFCREYGYDIEIGEVDFSARIPALASGKYEFTTTMNVTAERAEEVLFSDPVSEGGIVVAARADEIIPGEPDYTDYVGKRIGMVTGYSLEPQVLELFKGSKIFYQENFSDLVLALRTGGLDAFVADYPQIVGISLEEPEVSYLDKPLIEEDYSFAFSSCNEIALKALPQFNSYLSQQNQNGGMYALKEKWIEGDAVGDIEYHPEPGENGLLTVCIEAEYPPYTYVLNGSYAGLFIELIEDFAVEYGYGIKYEAGTLTSNVAGIAGGKYDIWAGCISVTEERKQSMNFSDPVYSGGMGLGVKASDLGIYNTEKEGFFKSIATSFEKNFIREDRWKMILRGIETTCIITLLSALLGTALAFLICMFRRTGSRLANGISNFFVKLLQGMPTVVLLMILYYVVFAKSKLSGTIVAIVGFTLNFAAYVSEIMRSGIEGIDPGQREAALALGYTENQAFFRFIFPQAAQRFLPVYRGELVSLLKSTSIVGYIAVQDLTKMSDIIRARTYEAFFPLIATALIYFILAWLIAIAMNALLKAFEPKRQRGVKAEKAKGGAEI